MNNNYIIIGDSLTYGIGDFETGGWSAMFKNYIVNKDDSKVCNNCVYVAAFPGATSTIILNKLDNIYQSFKHDEFTNTVILSIGVNDTQEFNGSLKTSLVDYEKNIKKIIDYVNKEGAKLIIFGLGRIQSDDKFYWKPGKFYCNENKIEYVSMKDVLDKTDYVDGLHPNKTGHEKIYKRAKEIIK